MSITNDQITAAVKSVLDDVADAVALRISRDREQYGPYGELSYTQLLDRAYNALNRVAKAIEFNDHFYLSQSLESVQRARIQANYEPKVVLLAMDAVAEELIRAVVAANPGNSFLCEAVRRRVNSFNNASKLQFARLNISIPQTERTTPDPDLQKTPRVGSK